MMYLDNGQTLVLCREDRFRIGSTVPPDGSLQFQCESRAPRGLRRQDKRVVHPLKIYERVIRDKQIIIIAQLNRAFD